jgi:uncharacterized membrane protein
MNYRNEQDEKFYFKTFIKAVKIFLIGFTIISVTFTMLFLIGLIVNEK